jgi:hypothetical protein
MDATISLNSRYKGIHALLLSWENGDGKIYNELKGLREVLDDTYGYDVEEWHIPLTDSHCQLNAHLLNWRKRHGTKGNLLIVYYAGHGIMGRGRDSVWLRYGSITAPFWSSRLRSL